MEVVSFPTRAAASGSGVAWYTSGEAVPPVQRSPVCPGGPRGPENVAATAGPVTPRRSGRPGPFQQSFPRA